MKFKKIISCVTILVICIALSACGNDLTDKKLKKLLKDNGYSYESAEIETILDLKSGIEGLEDGDQNKLVLISNDDYYGLAVINTETDTVTVPTFGYTPMNAVQMEIWSMGKDANIEDADIVKKYIERYGINALAVKEYAEEYLREITGANGIISTEMAQNIISNSTMQIFPNISSNDEVTVLFEDNSAVPMYYATESSQLVYNWSIFSEDVYKVWKASADRETQQLTEAMYGPPYVSRTVWAVVDSDLNEAGLYKSLDAAKNKLMK